MWYSDEWVQWLDFTCWKHLSGLWERESKGWMSCETKSQGVNKFMNWFLGHISVGMIFWDCRNVYGVCRSEKLAAEAALLPARGSCFSALPNVCRQLNSEQHLCQETINVTLLSHLSSHYYEFLVGPVVTLIWWQITIALFEAIWTALEFCKVWHSSAWGCVQHWCFLLKNCIETKIIVSRGWERLLNVGSKLRDLWSFH